MDKVRIKSKVGAFHTETSLGGGERLVFDWNAKNDFTCEVPTEVFYTDPLTKKLVKAQDNYAQHLLNSYAEILELVSVETVPVVVQPETKVSKKEKKQ